MTDLSICIITKNNEKYIENLLKHISIPNVEIIIGDLGSSDNTVTICRKYTNKIIGLNYTGDYASAKNYMKKLANSKWIAFLEPTDQIFGLDKIVAKLSELDENGYNIISIPFIYDIDAVDKVAKTFEILPFIFKPTYAEWQLPIFERLITSRDSNIYEYDMLNGVAVSKIHKEARTDQKEILTYEYSKLATVIEIETNKKNEMSIDMWNRPNQNKKNLMEAYEKLCYLKYYEGTPESLGFIIDNTYAMKYVLPKEFRSLVFKKFARFLTNINSKIEWFEKIIKAYPNCYDGFIELARCYYLQDNYKKSFDYLKRIEDQSDLMVFLPENQKFYYEFMFNYLMVMVAKPLNKEDYAIKYSNDAFAKRLYNESIIKLWYEINKQQIKTKKIAILIPCHYNALTSGKHIFNILRYFKEQSLIKNMEIFICFDDDEREFNSIKEFRNSINRVYSKDPELKVNVLTSPTTGKEMGTRELARRLWESAKHSFQYIFLLDEEKSFKPYFVERSVFLADKNLHIVDDYVYFTKNF